MTYLSRLLLNVRHRSVQRDLADCQQLHRTILRAFPDAPKGKGARETFSVLFRLEESSQPPCVLVQSSDPPDWDQLPPGYVMDSAHREVFKRIDGAYASLTYGRILRFRLRANPTKRVLHQTAANGTRWDGKRVDLQKEDDQIEWLRRKGLAGGFDVLSILTSPGVPQVQVMPGPKVIGRHGPTRLTFGAVVFEGVLRISDSLAFQQTLRKGVGSGKAYGFGLLSVAPTSSR